MQTILGAGGAIGTELAKALAAYGTPIRLVSRNPKKVNETDQLLAADLSNREEVFKSVEGSTVVYLTIGFEYNIAIWRSMWPSMMRNTLDACKKHNAKLVFFDNMYAYDPQFVGNMVENTPMKPQSEKGKVRAQIAQMLLDEVQAGNIQALIARAPDFYGPYNCKSVLLEMTFKPFSTKKPANWFGRTDKIHVFIYTPDAAKATAILGNTPEAFNQIWHLPCEQRRWTGMQFIEAIAQAMQVPPKVQVLPKWMCKMLGLFVPIMREFPEMYYQYESDYFFDCSKFQNRFHFEITPYETGIAYSVAHQ